MILLGDFLFVRIFSKNYRVTMTTTLELHVRKIQWFCQQGEGFCMHVFSSYMFSVIFVNFLVGLNKEQIVLLSFPSIVRLLS